MYTRKGYWVAAKKPVEKAVMRYVEAACSKRKQQQLGRLNGWRWSIGHILTIFSKCLISLRQRLLKVAPTSLATLFLPWPWTSSYDIDIQTWPG